MKLIAKISMLLAATCFMVASCDPAEKPEGPDIVVPPTPEPGPEPTPDPGCWCGEGAEKGRTAKI